ncbi:MAG: polyprenyl synthetase family protein [Promethearchaeota archaeon]
MNFKEILNQEVVKINESIRTFFKTRTHAEGDSFVDHYYRTIEDYIMFGGKRLRPFLLIQAFKGISGNDDPRIYRPSLCVEFLHNASLIHDDIIDRDDMRRGNPAFHFLFKKYYEDNDYKFASATHFGTTMGILGGDSTFFLGLEALQCDFSPEINEKAITLYCKAYHDICDGVLMEMNFVQIPEITEEQYLKMVSLKTGALIEKALLIGATFATANEKTMSLLSDYAINFGKAFQIKDDNLGTFGDESQTGKPSDGDIKDGKKTLLLLKAIEKASSSQLAFLKEHVGHPGVSESDVNEVRKIFEETGARDYCNDKVKEFSESAINSIEKLGNSMDDEQKEVLISLIKYNMLREK